MRQSRLRLALAGLAVLYSAAVLPFDVASGEESASATVVVNPHTVVMELLDANVQEGTTARLQTTVGNLGTETLVNVIVTLEVQSAQVGSQGGFSQTIRRIRPNREAQLSWRLCSNTPGSYVVMVSATAAGSGGQEFRSESAALVLEVTEGGRSCSGGFRFRESA